VNQFLLFLRSVLISVAVFLVMAFFAAKFFGGTLFPKSPRVDFPAVTVGGQAYFLSVTREAGKSPAFSLRQLDATDDEKSVLVAPQSDTEAAAWSWAELARPAEGGIAVRFTQRDGRTGTCSVDAAGKVKFTTD
jgi:hypothetical protein